jgi:hypothetical protein
MRGKRGTTGQRAYALPMQGSGNDTLAARMLLRPMRELSTTRVGRVYPR